MSRRKVRGGRFNGSDYVPERDDSRLSRQHERVRELMLDGKKRTLQEIASETGDPPASVSAQLRHLRKPRFGSWNVRKCHVGRGLYKYWIDGKAAR